MEKFSANLDGLHMELALPDSCSQALLFIHGWKSSTRAARRYMEALGERGFLCAALDLRGHGQSEGDIHGASRRDFLDDCLEAFDFLKAEWGLPVTVIGSSFGAYLATLLSAKREVERLVLRVPANYPDEGFSRPPALSSRLDPMDYEDTLPLRVLGDFAGPVLVVESQLDEVVPEWMVEQYVEAADQAEHVIMEGAPHTISPHPQLAEQYANIVADWLSSQP